MATAYVQPKDHLIRNVPWARLRKDADDNVLGVNAIAFRLREDEPYLSTTWLEFFKQQKKADRLHAAIRIIRLSAMPPTPKSGFALGNVKEIVDACASRKRRIRVVHERTDDNDAHVAVRQWPTDDDELFEILATGAWSEFVLNKDIPA